MRTSKPDSGAVMIEYVLVAAMFVLLLASAAVGLTNSYNKRKAITNEVLENFTPCTTSGSGVLGQTPTECY